MEPILLLGALILAGGAQLVALRLRAEVLRAQQIATAATREAAQAREQAAAAERALDELRARLQRIQDDLVALRDQVESPPPLTLPKGRSANLDDLREQLKAAQQEASEAEEA